MPSGFKSLPIRIWRFYYDGFRNMTGWGKAVWIVILVKLFIIFAVIRLFFMPDVLKRDFESDRQRSDHVIENLTNPKL